MQAERALAIVSHLPDRDTPAIERNGLDRSLNRDCPVVQRDLCAGYGELEQVFREAKQQDVAELFREAARHVPGCQ